MYTPISAEMFATRYAKLSNEKKYCVTAMLNAAEKQERREKKIIPFPKQKIHS